MLKRLYFRISLSIFSLLSFSNSAPILSDTTPVTDWFENYGNYNAMSVATDSKGNFYTAGYAYEGLSGQKSLGDDDAVIMKYSSDGTRYWVQQFGSNKRDRALSVATDAKGNIYVAGLTGRASPGQKYLSNSDAFIKKYDTNGKVLWTQQFGTTAVDAVLSVATDAKGNIYITGFTDGALPGQTSSGYRDAFIRKYDTNGTVLWTQQFGSDKEDVATSVATDASGNIFFAGYTWGALPDQKSSGKDDAFIRKYDTNGKVLWTQQFGSKGGDGALSVATDAKGNIYITGVTDGALPGQKSSGQNDAFIKKYDTNGKVLWTQQFGSNKEDNASSVATDAKGNIYLTGLTYGSIARMTYTQARTGLGLSGKLATYIRKYDANGKAMYTHQLTYSDNTANMSVAKDIQGNIYVGGFVDIAVPYQKSRVVTEAFLAKFIGSVP